MYLPVHFREDRLEIQHELIRTHPLGLLISAGASGLLANPLPFLVDASASKLGTLQAHLARANGHWQELAAGGECLVVFQGPQAYVTPSWYETKRETGKVVPTWNYVTVHAWGRARVIEDAVWLRRQIGALTTSQEVRRARPWHVEDAPVDFLDSQIRAIVGLEIAIDRIEGKWKVSQNRQAKDRSGVVAGMSEMGEMERAVARLVEERGQ